MLYTININLSSLDSSVVEVDARVLGLTSSDDDADSFPFVGIVGLTQLRGL